MPIFNGIATRITESYYYKQNLYWSLRSNLPEDNSQIIGLIGLANTLLTYQNIVPIFIELVRTLQAYFFWANDDLALDGRQTLARSWNLSKNLAQIKYIFSNKTGTLTQNLMQFRKCTISDTVYQGSRSQPIAVGEEEELQMGNLDPRGPAEAMM
ncbi:hypothetical protein PTTG_03791 [Puccinia triticina 1-1 BBBD Race 1]|uniref:P-type ATPase C-terminal domain-containing protein n=1 Tax=Puccinia triticina (isolate 1-1 / race 1 (BBBD)) TaxID=630390 RepID=A0A180GQ63_PUCT1|nr:hypothetical protein PTTG_03791 [Puccinia triticina 1-1 BBBD Race 1]